jgi:hypothetical protein
VFLLFWGGWSTWQSTPWAIRWSCRHRSHTLEHVVSVYWAHWEVFHRSGRRQACIFRLRWDCRWFSRASLTRILGSSTIILYLLSNN